MAILDNLQIKATGDTTSAQRSLTALIKKYEKLTIAAKEANEAMGGGDGGGGHTPPPNPIKPLDDAAKKATKSMGGLFASIKRIAFYRLIRSAIKAVTSGFAEGVKAAYAWAEANNDAFKQVMDRYATRTNYLKNTLGALASTVLTALLPAFLSITDAIVKGINYVNEFIAAIAGADDFLRAKEVMVEFGDAADNAAGAQKKLNQQLMAFDELNVITTPKSSGKDDSLNWKDAFERVLVSDKMKQMGTKVRNILDRIKEVFTPIIDFLKDHAPDISEIIGAIADGMERIKSSVSPEAKEFLGALVDAANSTLPGEITALATAISGLVEALEGLFGLSPKGVDPLKQILGGLAKVFVSLWFASALAMAGIVDFFAKLGGQDTHAVEGVKQDLETIIAAIDNWQNNPNFTLTKGLTGGTTNGGYRNSYDGKNYGELLFDYTPTPKTPVPVIPTTYGNSTTKDKRSVLLDESNMLTFASGGFPNMGSVFVAGEVPGQSEMVGTINGRTGVASGEEITGISEAVYSTGGETAALLRQLIAVVSDGGSMRPSAAFGRFASESLRLYKGVTG